MSDNKKVVQQIWGIVLLVTGGGMFFAIPGKIRTIQEAGGYSQGKVLFLQICFYIISIILVLGGGKKIYTYFLAKDDSSEQTPGD